MTEPTPDQKKGGGFTGWVDGRIKVAVTAATTAAVDALSGKIDARLDRFMADLRRRLDDLVPEVTGEVGERIEGAIRSLIPDQLEQFLPRILDGLGRGINIGGFRPFGATPPPGLLLDDNGIIQPGNIPTAMTAHGHDED